MKWMILIALCVFALFSFIDYRETGHVASLLILVACGIGLVLNYFYTPDGAGAELEDEPTQRSL